MLRGMIFEFNSETFGLEFEKYLPTDFTGRYMRKEGYLFPDTYFFYKEMEPVDVCQKIYINFNKRMKELDIYISEGNTTTVNCQLSTVHCANGASNYNCGYRL